MRSIAALILQVDAGLLSGFPAGDAAGGGPQIRIGSLVQGVDQVGGLTLQALNMPSPGLGAWTVDITYDGSVVAATSCSGLAGGVCNPAFHPTTARVTGAAASGYVGNTDLASINFRCIAQGQSAITLNVLVLADATAGSPQSISASVQNGTITCGGGVPGDVNCSGTLTVVDAALILQYDAGIISSLPCPENADVNHDGHINPVDAALILQFDAGLIDHL